MIVNFEKDWLDRIKFMVKVQRAKECINLVKKYRRRYYEYN